MLEGVRVGGGNLTLTILYAYMPKRGHENRMSLVHGAIVVGCVRFSTRNFGPSSIGVADMNIT